MSPNFIDSVYARECSLGTAVHCGAGGPSADGCVGGVVPASIRIPYSPDQESLLDLVRHTPLAYYVTLDQRADDSIYLHLVKSADGSPLVLSLWSILAALLEGDLSVVSSKAPDAVARQTLTTLQAVIGRTGLPS